MVFGKTARHRRRSWFSRFFRTFFSWLLTNLTVTLFWVLLFLLNRTTVSGRHHVDGEPNTLLLSNHQSMIDSFLVGLAVYYPVSWIKPHLIPWNPAAQENFFANPFVAFLARIWRCIPVQEGRRDTGALREMISILPTGVLTLFPEGTRSRDGSIGRGRPGAGLVVLSTRPRVIPVSVEGMRDVLPIGSYVPRIFKRIYVHYGEPIDYSDLLDMPRNKETAQVVVDRVMDAIEEKHAEFRRLREARLK